MIGYTSFETIMQRKIYLVVTPFFSEPDDFRGPYVLDQVKALMRVSDFEVVVMKPVPLWVKPEDYEIDGVQVYRFRQYTLPSNLLPNRLCDSLSARSMIRKLHAIGINASDIAVCHGHVTAFGAFALAVKRENPDCIAVVQHHGFDVMSTTDGQLAKYKWHEQWCVDYGHRICNSVDLNIGVSKKTLEYVRQYPGVRMKREYVLYNGVDTTKFFPDDKKPKHEGFVIGCIGNFWPLKDQMTLIRAVERLVMGGEKDIRVRFVGTGATLAACKQYVADHQLHTYFSFEQEVMHEVLRSFYCNLDLFVLPSYWEAFGCVYTEAYACGVPFMAVKEQGIGEIIPIEDQNRWLIDKGDDARLADLIAEYMHSPQTQKLNIPYKIDELMKVYVDYIQKIR